MQNASYAIAALPKCSRKSTKMSSGGEANLRNTILCFSSSGAPATPVAIFGSRSAALAFVSDYRLIVNVAVPYPSATANTTPSPARCGRTLTCFAWNCTNIIRNLSQKAQAIKFLKWIERQYLDNSYTTEEKANRLVVWINIKILSISLTCPA